MVITLDVTTMVTYNSPLVTWLALAIWSAVLGLTALLAGTLSDERTAKIAELHDAYVGVVEVVARYLNSADPKANDQATRVSLLSRTVAARMGLPDKEADNIRVAALLQDINHIEVTAKVIRKAVGDLKHSVRKHGGTHVSWQRSRLFAGGRTDGSVAVAHRSRQLPRPSGAALPPTRGLRRCPA